MSHNVHTAGQSQCWGAARSAASRLAFEKEWYSREGGRSCRRPKGTFGGGHNVRYFEDGQARARRAALGRAKAVAAMDAWGTGDDVAHHLVAWIARRESED